MIQVLHMTISIGPRVRFFLDILHTSKICPLFFSNPHNVNKIFCTCQQENEDQQQQHSRGFEKIIGPILEIWRKSRKNLTQAWNTILGRFKIRMKFLQIFWVSWLFKYVLIKNGLYIPAHFFREKYWNCDGISWDSNETQKHLNYTIHPPN